MAFTCSANTMMTSVNGRRLVHWHTFEYLISTLMWKLFSDRLKLCIPNVVCERVPVHINHSHISWSLHFSQSYFYRVFTFRLVLVYRIWEWENRNFPVAAMHSIPLCSCQLTNVFNLANSSRRLSGNWDAQNFSVSIFFVFYFQLWYFFIAAICDDMTVRLRDGVADILYLASREFVCLNKRFCVSHKCGVGLGLINGMTYRFFSSVVYRNWTAKADTVARSFRLRKFDCTFVCVRQSLLFVYNTVNNYIFLSMSPSIDRPSFPSSRLLHCYSFEFDKLFSMKTLNPTNSRKYFAISLSGCVWRDSIWD